MAEEFHGTYQKLFEMSALKKRASSDHKDYNRVKRHSKEKNTVFVPPPSGVMICENWACRSTIANNMEFCNKCSCCICHKYDDNKDLSLWLECSSEFGSNDSCGSSCHIECAMQCGYLSQLDGTYSCAWASCDKVSSIIGCWKKQLMIAKDVRSVGDVCYRIFLTYRLLDGTSKYKELHKFTQELKDLLEKDLMVPINRAIEMSHVSYRRSSTAKEVQRLCSLAVENADKLLNAESSQVGGSSGSDVSGDFVQPEVQLGVMQPTSHFDLNFPPVLDLNEEPRVPNSAETCVMGENFEKIVKTGLPTSQFDLYFAPVLNLNEEPHVPNTTWTCVLGENFEKIVKTVCQLEKEGHISEKFRLKFLTWFSTGAGERERRIVNIFEQTLGDEPTSFARQLVDTFSSVVFSGKND